MTSVINDPKVSTSKFMRWMNPFRTGLNQAKDAVSTVRRIPDGTRMYCVGDIHGRDDLLGEMAEHLKADMNVRSF